MSFNLQTITVILLGILLPLGFVVYLLSLLVRSLHKYLRTPERQPEGRRIQEAETAAIRRSLAEILKTRRLEKGMTQELVAEALGVSRQAVSKWETGDSFS